MHYKPELDGIRFLAVLLVLLTHMQLGVTGGFVGVDVFFVLSGFLITGIIVSSVEQQKFGFWNFYGRRLLRLYPALLTVVLLTGIAYALITEPATFAGMARSARYVLFSISNIFYNTHSGYFDQPAQTQAFLHTWSLGVEWQFYIIWPFIIVLTYKLTQSRKVLVSILALIVLLSLIGSQWGIKNSPNAAYYLVPYRAFELGIGGLLFFFYPTPLSPKKGMALTAFGVLALLIVSFFYTSATPFPGLAALVPCLAAASIMWGAKAFDKGNFFRLNWVVYLGKASYSIYLVHWPVLVLTKYALFRPLLVSERIVLVIVSIVLGCLVYTLVETNLNWRKLKHKFKGSMVMIAATLLLLTPFYYGSKVDVGMKWRVANNPLAAPQYEEWGLVNTPHIATLGDAEGKLFAIIGGDSFAANSAAGWDQLLQQSGLKVVRYYEAGCLMSLAELDGFSFQPVCRERSKQFIKAAQEHPELPVVMIQAWGGPDLDADTRGVPPNPVAQAKYNEQIVINLQDVHQRIGTNRPLFIFGSPPYRHWGIGERECLLRPNFGLNKQCQKEVPPYPPEASPVHSANMALKAYAEQTPNVYYIDLNEATCPNGTCDATHNAMLYFDGFHTSIYGANVIIEAGLKTMKKILADPS